MSQNIYFLFQTKKNIHIHRNKKQKELKNIEKQKKPKKKRRKRMLLFLTISVENLTYRMISFGNFLSVLLT